MYSVKTKWTELHLIWVSKSSPSIVIINIRIISSVYHPSLNVTLPIIMLNSPSIDYRRIDIAV